MVVDYLFPTFLIVVMFVCCLKREPMTEMCRIMRILFTRWRYQSGVSVNWRSLFGSQDWHFQNNWPDTVKISWCTEHRWLWKIPPKYVKLKSFSLLLDLIKNKSKKVTKSWKYLKMSIWTRKVKLHILATLLISCWKNFSSSLSLFLLLRVFYLLNFITFFQHGSPRMAYGFGYHLNLDLGLMVSTLLKASYSKVGPKLPEWARKTSRTTLLLSLLHYLKCAETKRSRSLAWSKPPYSRA